MKISIITVFPELYNSFLSTSLVQRAIEKNIISFNIVRFSDLCAPKERIDEPVCGPGAGMILKPELLDRAIGEVESKFGPGYKIFFSPQGIKIDQSFLKKISEKLFFSNSKEVISKLDFDLNRSNLNSLDESTDSSYPLDSAKSQSHIILICSRYEGVDSRVEEFYSNLILSIGDYVLMGGDLPAQVFLEGILRFCPGVVGKQESVENDSFSGPFLDYPQYGLPTDWNGLKIPEIILSGNHKDIENYRDQRRAKKTILNRFDWFRNFHSLSKEDRDLGKEFIPPHYVVLMHDDIYVKADLVGRSSITSMDIHDIARSSATYGLKKYFLVSSLKDQQAIAATFLDFWKSTSGQEYNPSRFEAVRRVERARSFSEVIESIEKKEGKQPLIISTSAKKHGHSKIIDYFSQGEVWKHERPVLLVLGTGHGLTDEILEKSDYLLIPVNGLSNYNHLSVRSAAAIIFDRWLGLNPKLGNDLE